ncbi:MAG: NTP transferase domain-containing protein, partial [Clostridiales bacterium]|nr:NTP transferase domain-containing protein [Clostridiales bacterium]
MALYRTIRNRLRKKPFCTAVIVAAGSSTRMGQDKMMLELAGIPVLVR